MKRFSIWIVVLTLGVGFIYAPSLTLTASAASPDEDKAEAFYKGKTVEFVVATSPGGPYDTLARLTAPYLSKHLGAMVIVRNEVGAGGKVALNRLAKQNNGLSLFTSAIQTAAVSQIFGEPGVSFDLTKFNWLGTMGSDQYTVVVGKKSGYKSIIDLQQAKEVKFGADTKTSGKATRPRVMGYLLGVNVKLVTGYKGTADELLALQRGEVEGLSPTIMTNLPYMQSGEMIPLLAWAPERFKVIPNVPTIFEAKKMSAQEKRIASVTVALNAVGRPVATTPGVPQERVAFLESALRKALVEPELLKKFEVMGETVDCATGKETSEAIHLMLSIREDEKAILGKLMGVEGY